MKLNRIKFLILLLISGFFLNSCFLFPQFGEGWLFMIYMAGDNSLSDYVADDINEIEQGLYDSLQAGNMNLEYDVKVLVLADTSGSADTRLYLAVPDNTSSVVSTVLNEDVYTSGQELNMADGATLQHFISFAMNKYPAAHNSLILWNHGGGIKSLEASEIPSREICEDGGDYLYMNELQTALTGALGGNTLDVLGIDACIMGEVENAYELRNHTDYYVASMAEEWGYGWGYRYIFNKFGTAGYVPGSGEMADILVSQFRDSTYGVNTYWPNTMTAVKSSGVAVLKTAIDALAAAIYNDSGDPQTEFQDMRDATVFYYTQRPSDVAVVDDDSYELQILANPYYDLYDLCSNIVNISGFGSNVKTAAQNVLDALNYAVVASYGNSSVWDGLASNDTIDDLSLNYYSTDDITAVRGLSIFIPHGELLYNDVSHYAYDWWYSTVLTTHPTYGVDWGGLDFCSSNTNGTVETWRELFEAWYDGGGYTPGSY